MLVKLSRREVLVHLFGARWVMQGMRLALRISWPVRHILGRVTNASTPSRTNLPNCQVTGRLNQLTRVLSVALLCAGAVDPTTGPRGWRATKNSVLVVVLCCAFDPC